MTPTKNGTSLIPTRRGRASALVGAAVAAMFLVAALPAAVAARDRNNDRIPDLWERQHGLSLKVNQARKDQDKDALRNRAEFQSQMDPQDADSDDDGVDDGDEGAGTIGSFDPATGRLRIDLFNGDTVTGLVTDDTEVDCDEGDDEGDEDGDHHGGDDGDDRDGDDQSDNSGPGSESSGPGSGGDESDDEDGDDDADEVDDERECSSDDLAVGTVVQEADLEVGSLEVGSGGAFWEEIELLTR